MDQKELKIDAAVVARETLRERQPGEDLEFPADISTCSQCGKKVKSSFWAGLFGR